MFKIGQFAPGSIISHIGVLVAMEHTWECVESHRVCCSETFSHRASVTEHMAARPSRRVGHPLHCGVRSPPSETLKFGSKVIGIHTYWSPWNTHGSVLKVVVFVARRPSPAEQELLNTWPQEHPEGWDTYFIVVFGRLPVKP
eukprot:TRINITY_DN66774_c5_g1_i4.p1 TRINITY_DN66774_c5_g1~~TRINITY_DN66774_c5_g1_i4.p1  ORF type:complete len:142 (-),score=1.91 TRINITY_DN66774_c5_g1_i4:49-474(-)